MSNSYTVLARAKDPLNQRVSYSVRKLFTGLITATLMA